MIPPFVCCNKAAAVATLQHLGNVGREFYHETAPTAPAAALRETFASRASSQVDQQFFNIQFFLGGCTYE
jgi:hypothetical protein